MNYAQTLEYLYGQLPMYQRVGNAAFKKGLGNTLALLEFLDDPHTSYPKIHIAGTNGKGTVSHMLAACYQAGGYNVGLYTSPHYVDFRERFKVNGRMVSKRYVTRFVERIKPAIAEVKPSFFEITVAMAFDVFREAKVDIAVIETGLGGRLDSTNVIEPIISVITNISFDHMEMLGDTLPKIAGEKAGIIKHGRPVVIGESHPETDAVFAARAKAMEAPIVFADREMNVSLSQGNSLAATKCTVSSEPNIERTFSIPSMSPFVGANLVTAIRSLDVLNTLPGAPPLPDNAIKSGLERFPALTNYIGRWQLLGTSPLIIADSAHNEAGLAKTIPAVTALPHDRLHIVLGVVKEKDLDKALAHFPENARYYFCKPDVPRGLDANSLAATASAKGLTGQVYSSVRKAFAAARRRAGSKDLIFVGGSSFVVAEVVSRRQ